MPKRKLRNEKRPVSHGPASENDITAKDFLDALGTDHNEEMVEIIRLRKRGLNPGEIAKRLGFSRATYYRRQSKIDQLLRGSPEKTKRQLAGEIGQIYLFFQMLEQEALGMAGFRDELCGTERSEPVSTKIKQRGLRLALEAHDKKVRFLFSVGHFDAYRAEQKAKAAEIKIRKIDSELRPHLNALMDENFKLRENLAALRNGDPEPHDLNDPPNLDEQILSIPREKRETKRKNDPSRMMH